MNRFKTVMIKLEKHHPFYSLLLQLFRSQFFECTFAFIVNNLLNSVLTFLTCLKKFVAIAGLHFPEGFKIPKRSDNLSENFHAHSNHICCCLDIIFLCSLLTNLSH